MKFQFFVSTQSSGHVFFVTKKKILMSFGNNGSGQCALGHDESPIKIPREVKSKHFSGQHIRKIVLGEYTTIFHLKDFRVFCCGKNNFGMLGLGDLKNRSSPTEIKFELRINDVFIGCRFTILLDSFGVCYNCGNNGQGQLGLGDQEKRLIPMKMKLNERVVSASGGYGFALFLCNGNVVYKTGRVYNENMVEVPQKLVFKLKSNLERLKKVVCGENHFLILSDLGNVYAQGNNDRGVFSRTLNTCDSPSLITALVNKNIIDVDTGSHYSIFLTKNGTSLAFGSNTYIGFEKSMEDKKTGLITFKKNVAQINAASYASFFIMKNGDIWAGGHRSSKDNLGFSALYNYNDYLKGEKSAICRLMKNIKNVLCINEYGSLIWINFNPITNNVYTDITIITFM